MSSIASDEAYVQISYLVPITEDNFLGDGSLHSHTRWELHNDELYKQFGGSTQAPGLFYGVYKDPDNNNMVADKSVEFRVAIPAKELDRLRGFLKDFVAPLFRQKLIFLVITGPAELIECNRENIDNLP